MLIQIQKMTVLSILSLLAPVLSANAEDLAAPPAIFSVEQFDNPQQVITNEVLEDNSLTLNIDDASNSLNIDMETINRPLLADTAYSAKISLVNRRTNLLDTLNFNNANNTVLHKGVNIHVAQCLKDYKGDFGNDIAFVELTAEKDGALLFEGWIYKKRPSVNMFEHPVYSLALVACS